ncbi:hypothetical protein NG799_14670 [Laspinema sp. D1]|uniref:Uncharacterized protein n=1 Tax=Laspinema palackyanum D2a TaxID=2953684 RepID=A0ABT2MVQ6_9CYAN|nr:hypothetical protein [Laspinema sp. D2b]MCT7967581.1 hypothetical protein [Laspinema sp. D2a]
MLRIVQSGRRSRQTADLSVTENPVKSCQVNRSDALLRDGLTPDWEAQINKT